MIKLIDLLREGKYTVDFDIGSRGLMSQTVNAKNEKEAAKKVAAGISGKVKIKKVTKESISIGDQYVGATRLKDGKQVQLLRSTEVDRYSIGKKYGIKKHDYYLLIEAKGANYVVDTGTHILKKAGKWAQGYIQRKLGGTGKERFT